MAESIRELVVTLSMEADSFSKTATNIQQQIKNVESAFKAMGDGTGQWGNTLDGQKAKLSSLGGTLQLQQANVTNYSEAWKKAKAALDSATDDKSRLAAAKHLTEVETKLNNAKAAVNATTAEIKRLQAEVNAFKFNKFGDAMVGAGKQMQQFGRSMSLYVTAPLVALGTKAYTAAAEYESAFAGVRKTTEATEEQFAGLNSALLEMSERMPAAYEELAGIMEMGGSGGISTDNLVKFTETMAMLGEATDMSAEQVANAMAQFLNVTSDGEEAIDRVGATLVDLGNNSAATESQIFGMAQRMAATATQAGLTTDQILGVSAALTSMGIEAEAGGTAAGKLLKAMQLAAETGKDAEAFAKVMGVSTKEFTDGWNINAGESMLAFFQGLSDMDDAGISSILKSLDEMGLTEVRLSNMITAAANNPQFFAEMLGTAAAAWDENTALYNEAAQRFATTESQNQMMMNKLSNAAADLGVNVIAAMQPIIEAVTGLINEFNKLDEETQSKIVKVAGAFALLGPAALTIGTVTKTIGTLSKGIGTLVELGTKLGPSLVTNLGKIAASPLFAPLAATAAIWAVIKLMEMSAEGLSPDKFIPNEVADISESLETFTATGEEAEAAKTKVGGFLEQYNKVRDAMFNVDVTSIENQQALWESVLPQDVLDRLAGGLEVSQLLGPGSPITSIALQYMAELEKQAREAATLAGIAIPEGMQEGVVQSTPLAVESAGTLADEVNKAVTSPLGIQSPSTVMIGHGINIATGVSVGILQALPIAAAAMQTLGAAVSAIAAAQGAAAGAAYGASFGNTASASFSVALAKIRTELAALERRIAAGYGSTPHYNVGGR